MSVPPLVETWVLRLRRESDGLDLSDREDCAIFRGRVAAAMKGFRVFGMMDLFPYFGVDLHVTSRDGAVRALANAFIKGTVVRLKDSVDGYVLTPSGGLSWRAADSRLRAPSDDFRA